MCVCVLGECGGIGIVYGGLGDDDRWPRHGSLACWPQPAALTTASPYRWSEPTGPACSGVLLGCSPMHLEAAMGPLGCLIICVCVCMCGGGGGVSGGQDPSTVALRLFWAPTLHAPTSHAQ